MRLFLLTKPAQKPVSLFCSDIGTLYSKIFTKWAGALKKRGQKRRKARQGKGLAWLLKSFWVGGLNCYKHNIKTAKK